MSETTAEAVSGPNLTLSNSILEHEIAVLEHDRTAPLSAAQRGHLPAKLSDLAESIHALRAFRLADGGSEPAIVFHPLPGSPYSAAVDEIGEGGPHA